MGKKPTVADATGMASTHRPRPERNTPEGSTLAQARQHAMVEAVRACNAEGITDPKLVRERVLKVRDEMRKLG